ncbi:MAG TPA: phosphate-starvation-inducible PsiE family protein [Steroidobacteraceae bacterium]|nr:phosphate-starvation-inducible PsiE family protein [Steroidobacteraceae bacterium]
MVETSRKWNVINYFERAIIWFSQGLLVLLLTIVVFHTLRLIWVGFETRIFAVADISELQKLAQRGFAAVLLLMLGLELLDSLRTYFTEHRIRLEMILIVAMIALGRHVILLDVEHLDAMQLLGISALALSLTTGYFLVKRSAAPASA